MLLLLLACRPPELEPTWEIWNEGHCLRVQGASATLFDDEGHEVLVDALPMAFLEDGSSLTLDPEDTVVTQVEEGLDLLSGPLSWELRAVEGGAWTVQLHIDADRPMSVARAHALRSDRLVLGPDPTTHRVLENGSFTALDFLPEVLAGDIPNREGYALLAPGTWEGESVSNSNHAIGDLDSEATWVAGALTFEGTFPAVELSFAPSIEDPADSFTFFAVGGNWLPEPASVAVGERLSTELFWFHPAPESVQQGLEDYADAVAEQLDIVPWHRREQGRRVPNGWNSWGGGAGTGGYGTDINEDLLLANADFMARELLPFGMEWFQIDDGYEPHYGDWLTWREDRFPHGPAWLADQIRALGLRPGLWMAPFTAHPESALVAEHPDWLASKTQLGTLFVGELEILDLTHPQVQEHLRELGAAVHDWGFDWYKLDFGYYALFGTDFYEPMSREAAWNGGLEVVREGLGPDAFFLLVGTTMMNAGRVDSVRLGLDSEPVWDWDPTLGPEDLLDQQGLKPMVRTAARRWYLQDRVFVSHPDLLFFRSNTVDTDWPRLSLEESRALASFVGLGGGVVKLGDRLLDLEPEHVDVVRRLLPIHGGAARPMDVLEREFPEHYELTIEEGLDGLQGPWHLVGLFNWGTNQDLRTFSSLPEEDRTWELELPEGEWLAWEFWTEEYLGRAQGTLSVEVPARDCRVVVLREPLERPRFLGWNRQISQGGTLMQEETWQDQRLTLRFDAAAGTDFAPFEHHLVVHAPEGFELQQVEGAQGTQEGELIELTLTGQGPVDVVLSF